MSLNVEELARICHEVNRAYCASLGDHSQRNWDDAPQWQRESAIDGVKFALDNPFATPESLHDNWLKLKVEDGWVYGPKKDPDKKVHPCLLPYEKLPKDQQTKDKLFRAVVHASLLGRATR